MCKKLILFFLIVLSIKSFAGWVIIERINDSNMECLDSTVMIIHKNKVKLIERNLTTIFDLNNGVITFLNPYTKSYWKGTISEYREASKKAIQIHLGNALNIVSEKHKYMYNLMYEDLMKTLDNREEKISLQKLDIEVRRTREKSVILDYTAEKYQLWNGTILIEDVWIGKDIGIVDEFDLEKYSNLKNEIITDADQITYQASSDYLALMKRGYVLKTIEYGFGYKNLKEVTRLEEKDILESEFILSDEFERVTITELELFKKSAMDAENYREY